jgi:hypothetical protein
MNNYDKSYRDINNHKEQNDKDSIFIDVIILLIIITSGILIWAIS